MAATPPADHLLEQGLLATAKSYALLVDRSTETPAEDMSPTSSPDGSTARFCGGRSAATSRDARRAAAVIPLLHERERPPLSYRITFGIRHNEQDWKRRLNQAIRKRQADFDRVLRDFGVPLLDDNDRLIAAPRNAAK